MSGSKPGERRGGRQAGTPNRINAATRARIEGQADPLGFLASIMRGEEMESALEKDSAVAVKVRPTLDQRISAAQTLARLTYPVPKDRPITLELPHVETAADVSKAMAVVSAAMAEGTITPAEAGTVAGVLETRRKAIETEELAARVEELEETLGRNAPAGRARGR